MRVAFYQLSPVFGDKGANLSRVAEGLARLKADVVVLPELFSTGYQFTSEAEVRELAEPFPGGETASRLRELSTRMGAAIAAGFLERSGEEIYNSAMILFPEGDPAVAAGNAGRAPGGADAVPFGLYRKVHLFSEEKRWMKPGDLGFPLFRWRGATIGLLVCFDWIFPEATRVLALQGMELLLHPSNLVLPHCQDAMRTRALENGIFAVTANRVGVEERDRTAPRLTFTGMSQVAGPRGEILCRAGREEELRVVEIDLELARAKQITPRNHLLDDRRPECYGALVE